MKQRRTLLVWLRFFRYKATPWTVLAIATLKLIWLCGIEQAEEEVRLMSALAKIDFARWFEIAQEIIDDLPYWFY